MQPQPSSRRRWALRVLTPTAALTVGAILLLCVIGLELTDSNDYIFLPDKRARGRSARPRRRRPSADRVGRDLLRRRDRAQGHDAREALRRPPFGLHPRPGKRSRPDRDPDLRGEPGRRLGDANLSAGRGGRRPPRDREEGHDHRERRVRGRARTGLPGRGKAPAHRPDRRGQRDPSARPGGCDRGDGWAADRHDVPLHRQTCRQAPGPAAHDRRRREGLEARQSWG